MAAHQQKHAIIGISSYYSRMDVLCLVWHSACNLQGRMSLVSRCRGLTRSRIRQTLITQLKQFAAGVNPPVVVLKLMSNRGTAAPSFPESRRRVIELFFTVRTADKDDPRRSTTNQKNNKRASPAPADLSKTPWSTRVPAGRDSISDGETTQTTSSNPSRICVSISFLAGATGSRKLPDLPLLH